MKFFATALLLILGLQQVVSQNDHLDFPGMTRLGEYQLSGAKNGKTYYVPLFTKASWADAISVCRSYGMELTSLDTIEEHDQFLNLCNEMRNFLAEHSFIGGIATLPASKEGWIWIHSGYRVNYTMKFIEGQPDFINNNERCLDVWKQEAVIALNDDSCYNPYSFICQLPFIER